MELIDSYPAGTRRRFNVQNNVILTSERLIDVETTFKRCCVPTALGNINLLGGLS